jgi:hypothetical protein
MKDGPSWRPTVAVAQAPSAQIASAANRPRLGALGWLGVVALVPLSALLRFRRSVAG